MELTSNERMEIIRHAFTLRRDALLRAMSGNGRDFNKEFGYPNTLTAVDYRDMYDREGVATRVVNIYPEECWAMNCLIFQNKEQKITPWEEKWKELDDKHNFYFWLSLADELSGVGHFGILLLGIGDGKELHEPVEGIDEKGEIEEGERPEVELLFLRAFDETAVRISKYQNDLQNPRYGQPLEYEITFSDPRDTPQGGLGVGPGADTTSRKVHWSRVIHLADNRKGNLVFGTPRQKCVFNRLLDIRKIAGGSGEMFWRGAFPGYSFEVDPRAMELGVEIDRESIKDEFEKYANSLQRYMAFLGGKVNSLAPQIAEPDKHIEVQIRLICISIGVPQRIFMGSEQAKVASQQDAGRWNTRLHKRQHGYVTPMVIRPFVNRLMAIGVLPKADEYFVEWPDLNTSSSEIRAKVAEGRTNALKNYVSGGVDAMIPPLEYWTYILDVPLDEAERIVKASEAHNKKLAEEQVAAGRVPPTATEKANQEMQMKLQDKELKAPFPKPAGPGGAKPAGAKPKKGGPSKPRPSPKNKSATSNGRAPS